MEMIRMSHTKGLLPLVGYYPDHIKTLKDII